MEVIVKWQHLDDERLGTTTSNIKKTPWHSVYPRLTLLFILITFHLTTRLSHFRSAIKGIGGIVYFDFNEDLSWWTWREGIFKIEIMPTIHDLKYLKIQALVFQKLFLMWENSEYSKHRTGNVWNTVQCPCGFLRILHQTNLNRTTSFLL